MNRNQPKTKGEYLRVTSQLPPDVSDAVLDRSKRDGVSQSAAVVAMLRDEINSPDKDLSQACRDFAAKTLTVTTDEERQNAATALTSTIIRIVVSELSGLSRRHPEPAALDIVAAEALSDVPPVKTLREEIEKLRSPKPAH